MTAADMPLPAPVLASYVTDSIGRSIACNSYTADQMRTHREEYAAARVAEVAGQMAEDSRRYHGLVDWLQRVGLLTCVRCQPEAGAPVGDWWVFRRPFLIDGSSPESYAKDEDSAIDTALAKFKETQHG